MSEVWPRDWRAWPGAPEPGVELGAADSVPDGGATSFEMGEGARAFSVIVVRRGQVFRGYLNVCPHFQLRLDSPNFPGRFLTRDSARLKCAHHLALFDIETGECIDGPAQGDMLVPVPITVGEEGRLRIAGSTSA